MTIKVTREYEIDDIGSHLLDSFLENDDTVILDEDIYFEQLDHFQQIEVLETMKEQFNNAVDDEIKNIKKEICNG
jgi:hypothetical protein